MLNTSFKILLGKRLAPEKNWFSILHNLAHLAVIRFDTGANTYLDPTIDARTFLNKNGRCAHDELRWCFTGGYSHLYDQLRKTKTPDKHQLRFVG